MRFDPKYKKEVIKQLNELRSYLLDLKGTLNPAFNDQVDEYNRVILIDELIKTANKEIALLPEPDYSFLDEFYESKKKEVEK